jgi:hypothetical protein
MGGLVWFDKIFQACGCGSLMIRSIVPENWMQSFVIHLNDGWWQSTILHARKFGNMTVARILKFISLQVSIY